MVFHANGNENKARVAILTSDKIDFKAKTVCNKGQRTVYNDKGTNPKRGYNNFKYICTQHRNT